MTQFGAVSNMLIPWQPCWVPNLKLTHQILLDCSLNQSKEEMAKSRTSNCRYAAFGRTAAPLS